MGLLRCFTRHISRPNLPAPRAKRAAQTPCVGPPLSPEVLASVEESRRSLEAMRPTYPEFAHSEPYRFPEIAGPAPAAIANTISPLIVRGPQRTAPESLSMPVLPHARFDSLTRLARRSSAYHDEQPLTGSSSILKRAKAWRKRNVRSRAEKTPTVMAAIAHTRRLRRDGRKQDEPSSPKQGERRTSMDVNVLRKLSDLTAKRRASDVAAQVNAARKPQNDLNSSITSLRKSFEVARKSIENARKSMERKSALKPIDSSPPRAESESTVVAVIDDQDLKKELSVDDSDMNNDDLSSPWDGLVNVDSGISLQQLDDVASVYPKQDDLVSLDSCSVSYAPMHDDNCSMMSDYPVSLDITRVSRASFGYDRNSIEDQPQSSGYIRLEKRSGNGGGGDKKRESAITQRFSYGFEQHDTVLDKRHSQTSQNERVSSYGNEQKRASLNSFDECGTSDLPVQDDLGLDEIDNTRRYEDSDDDYRTAREGVQESDEYRSVVRSISSQLTATSCSSSEGTIRRVTTPPMHASKYRLRRTDSSVELPRRRRNNRTTNAITNLPVHVPMHPNIPVRVAIEPNLRERSTR